MIPHAETGVAALADGAYGGDVIRRSIAVVLALLAASLVAMAHATPVDPTWIGGLYDNADGDDSVLAARSFVGQLDAPAPALGAPTVWAGAPLPSVSVPVVDSGITVRLQGRAPPSA
jgi:hypothetical protein